MTPGVDHVEPAQHRPLQTNPCPERRGWERGREGRKGRKGGKVVREGRKKNDMGDNERVKLYNYTNTKLCTRNLTYSSRRHGESKFLSIVLCNSETPITL